MSQITLKNLYNPIQFLALRPPSIVWGFIFDAKYIHNKNESIGESLRN